MDLKREIEIESRLEKLLIQIWLLRESINADKSLVTMLQQFLDSLLFIPTL